MPNNIVFNNVASELKTQIYGQDETGVLHGILTDTEGRIEVAISDTLNIRELSAATDSIALGGRIATESVVELTDFTDTGVVLQMDTSEQDIYSFYVLNADDSGDTLTVRLQVSPTEAEEYFIDDVAAGTFTLGIGDAAAIVPSKYFHYTRIYYDAGANGCTADFYYNARV